MSGMTTGKSRPSVNPMNRGSDNGGCGGEIKSAPEPIRVLSLSRDNENSEVLERLAIIAATAKFCIFHSAFFIYTHSHPCPSLHS